jgi:HK97 family phage portal protein
MHAVLAGDGFAYIDRRRDGTLRELFPIVPGTMRPYWNKDRAELEYHWRNTANGSPTILKSKDVLHLHGPSWNGYSGLEALQIARQAIGLSASLENETASASYRGNRPSGVLSNEAPITKEIRDQLRASWAEKFGPGGEGGIALLDGKWKFDAMQTSAVDSATIESRRFQLEEICRFTMVFPQMIMSNDKTQSYASSEQFFLAHLIHSLDPWLERFEQEIKKSVIGWDGENENLYPKFIRDGMLRASSADRSQAISASLGSGGSPAWRTQNEARALDDLNPLEDPAFDTLPAPVNVAPKPQNDTTATQKPQNDATNGGGND